MTNALTVYDQFDELERAAIALQQSGYFTDVKSKAQAIVKVMAGAELGLPPFASMTGIHIIQGKPVLGANVIATLVKNDPRYDYKVNEATDHECQLAFFENGNQIGKVGFTIEEAKSIGLATKDNWKKYPSDMLFARAISRGARRFAPGIFGGSPVYTPDEMGADVDEDGSVIVDSVAVEVTDPQPDKSEREISGQSDPLPIQKMSLETAQAITNRDGEKYGDLPVDKLSHMYNSLVDSIRTTQPPDEREEKEMKRDAIKVIMEDLNK